MFTLACIFCAGLGRVSPDHGIANQSHPLDVLVKLGKLSKEYEASGLPLPPKSARLVKVTDNRNVVVNGIPQPKQFQLAFLLAPGQNQQEPLLLWITRERKATTLELIEEAADDGTSLENYATMGEYDLILAIQCHSRGWQSLAKRLFELSQKNAKGTPSQQLARIAWEYWDLQLSHPTADRGPIAKRLKELIARNADLDTGANRWVMDRLELALVPGKAKPGTVEALIDDLVNYNSNMGAMVRQKPDEKYQRLAALGFDAVPALIEHLDDERLTRGMMQGFNNFRSWHLRVCDVVGELIESLACESLTRGTPDEDVGGGWLRRQQGYSIKKSAAQEWWGKARTIGEEQYLLAHVFPTDTEEKGQTQFVNTRVIDLIALKYPKRLGGIYRDLLEKHPATQSYEVLEAIERAKIAEREKLDLIVLGAKNRNLKHRLAAFHSLKMLDKGRLATMLIETLEGLPKDVEEKYWTCPEAAFSQLAMYCDDPKVWSTLEKVVKRSSVGLRMEMLDHMNCPKDAPNRTRRIRLLAAFLDDTALRNNADRRTQGPSAGFYYDRIRVCDFAADQIALLVDIKYEFKRDRSEKEWDELRETVRERLKREFPPEANTGDKPNR